ncbi:MAG: DUF6879 family protein [Streptosporangiaceae bacterium]
MNEAEFDACFDRLQSDVFRLETLQHYAVSEEDQRFRAFREGTPRPERSVRTSPWLARIAVTTTQGKHWRRVHVVDHPLSEYLRYELVGYVESSAAGEEILIADRTAHAGLAELAVDFWLFDASTAHAYAVLMRYDRDGHPVAFDYAEDSDTLDRCRFERDLTVAHAVPLNAYLTSQRGRRRVA